MPKSHHQLTDPRHCSNWRTDAPDYYSPHMRLPTPGRHHSSTSGSAPGGSNPRETERIRRRIQVACARCRKRKIKCSGPTQDGICQNCKSAGASSDECQYHRVQSKNIEWDDQQIGTSSAASASSQATLVDPNHQTLASQDYNRWSTEFHADSSQARSYIPFGYNHSIEYYGPRATPSSTARSAGNSPIYPASSQGSYNADAPTRNMSVGSASMSSPTSSSQLGNPSPSTTVPTRQLSSPASSSNPLEAYSGGQSVSSSNQLQAYNAVSAGPTHFYAYSDVGDIQALNATPDLSPMYGDPCPPRSVASSSSGPLIPNVQPFATNTETPGLAFDSVGATNMLSPRYGVGYGQNIQGQLSNDCIQHSSLNTGQAISTQPFNAVYDMTGNPLYSLPNDPDMMSTENLRAEAARLSSLPAEDRSRRFLQRRCPPGYPGYGNYSKEDRRRH